MSDTKMSGPDRSAVRRAASATEKTKLPLTTTVKLSRFLREYVIARAEWNESIDHAFRRLLCLPVEDGKKIPAVIPDLTPDKKAVKDAFVIAAKPGITPTVTVKVSRFLREYVLAKAKPTESIDFTLRRLLGLPFEEKEAS